MASITLILVTLICSLFFFFSNEDETEVAVQAKKDIFILTSNQVVDVYDGDTFKIDLPSMHPLFGDDLSIRLFGLDTPEMRGTTDEVKALAMQAQELAENALKGASRKNCGILKGGSIFALYARCGSMENRLPICSRQRVWRRTMMGRGLGRSGEGEVLVFDFLAVFVGFAIYLLPIFIPPNGRPMLFSVLVV
jgi:hypothetical protein